MSGKKNISIEDFINNPEIQKVINPVNLELKERRSFVPDICDIFSSPYTALKDTDEFTFFIDKEAKKQLPRIIDNKVQRVVGIESPDLSSKKDFSKKRNIGIVFSGGPAPGGHGGSGGGDIRY